MTATFSYRSLGTAIEAGAELVATWDDGGGVPLVVTREIGGRRRCDLNFWLPSTDTHAGGIDPTTDAYTLVANAIDWVAGRL